MHFACFRRMVSEELPCLVQFLFCTFQNIEIIHVVLIPIMKQPVADHFFCPVAGMGHVMELSD